MLLRVTLQHVNPCRCGMAGLSWADGYARTSIALIHGLEPGEISFQSDSPLYGKVHLSSRLDTPLLRQIYNTSPPISLASPPPHAKPTWKPSTCPNIFSFSALFHQTHLLGFTSISPPPPLPRVRSRLRRRSSSPTPQTSTFTLGSRPSFR